MRVLQQVLDDGTDPWGVQVERVEMYVCSSCLHLSHLIAMITFCTQYIRAQGRI